MADRVQEQLDYLGEALGRLESQALHPSAISDAVANGMKQAVSSPEFWSAAIGAMGARTRSAAGGFLIEGVWGTLRKLGWFFLAGLAVYFVGGWTALVSLFKVIFGIDTLKP